LGNSWVERVTNVEVMRRMHKERESNNSNNTEKKIVKYRTCHEEREISSITKHLAGKNPRKDFHGRRRNSWLMNLREWFGCSINELFRA